VTQDEDSIMPPIAIDGSGSVDKKVEAAAVVEPTNCEAPLDNAQVSINAKAHVA
jgi:hypothetical protein